MIDPEYLARPAATLYAGDIRDAVEDMPKEIRSLADQVRPAGLLRRVSGGTWNVEAALESLEELDSEVEYLTSLLRDELDSRRAAGVE